MFANHELSKSIIYQYISRFYDYVNVRKFDKIFFLNILKLFKCYIV